jgi:methionyl-tRNA formyltransferase
MQLTQSAVKKYALAKGLHILQPVKLKAPDFLKELSALKADVQVVVAFRMLPEVVWNMPPLGTINLHASLLPYYRGAAPINWAIINGETETGLTTFKLQHEIDTGDVLLQKTLEIGEEETAGELHDRMMVEGGKLVLGTLQEYCSGTLKGKPQAFNSDANDLKLAPKLTSENCKINWDQPGKKIYNHIRGLSPYPASFTSWNDKLLKIYKSHFVKETTEHSPGEFKTDGKTFLKFAASDGWIEVLDLQLEGKKRMPVDAFLRGFRF